MISFVLATALAATVQGGPPMQPRRNFSDCLSRFAKAKAADKMDAATFRPALKTACAAEEAAFKASIVTYDVKMGSKRPAAETGADLEIEDYFANTADNYQVHNVPASAPK